jgi:hypothetical protein
MSDNKSLANGQPKLSADDTATEKAKAKLAKLKARRGRVDYPVPTYDDLKAETEALDRARCSAIRAIVTDAFEGDYQSGVEFLAAVLAEHACNSRMKAIEAVAGLPPLPGEDY